MWSILTPGAIARPEMSRFCGFTVPVNCVTGFDLLSKRRILIYGEVLVDLMIRFNLRVQDYFDKVDSD